MPIWRLEREIPVEISKANFADRTASSNPTLSAKYRRNSMLSWWFSQAYTAK